MRRGFKQNVNEAHRPSAPQPFQSNPKGVQHPHRDSQPHPANKPDKSQWRARVTSKSIGMVAAPSDDDIEMEPFGFFGAFGLFGAANSMMGVRVVNSFDDIDSEEDELEADFEQRMTDLRDGLRGLEGLK